MILEPRGGGVTKALGGSAKLAARMTSMSMAFVNTGAAGFFRMKEHKRL